MSAYGRKQPFGLSLNRGFRVIALGEKADIRLSDEAQSGQISLDFGSSRRQNWVELKRHKRKEHSHAHHACACCP